MDVEQLPGVIRHVRDGLYPALQPLIDITKGLPKTREVKSLERKLHRSYSSLDDAVTIMPDVLRSLEKYQPDLSFDLEGAEPTEEQHEPLRRALAELERERQQRGLMGAENALSYGIRQRNRNQRELERRAAAARGETLLHFHGGRRTRRRRKQKKTKKQRR